MNVNTNQGISKKGSRKSRCFSPELIPAASRSDCSVYMSELSDFQRTKGLARAKTYARHSVNGTNPQALEITGLYLQKNAKNRRNKLKKCCILFCHHLYWKCLHRRRCRKLLSYQVISAENCSCLTGAKEFAGFFFVLFQRKRTEPCAMQAIVNASRCRNRRLGIEA